MARHIWTDSEKELELGLENSWLVTDLEKELGPTKALILLIAVVQADKQSVTCHGLQGAQWLCRRVYGKCQCICTRQG